MTSRRTDPTKNLIKCKLPNTLYFTLLVIQFSHLGLYANQTIPLQANATEVAPQLNNPSLKSMNGSELSWQAFNEAIDDQEDIVISSSEILTSKFANKRPYIKHIKMDDNNCSTTTIESLDFAHNSSSASDGDEDDVNYSNSRLLLRLLVIGLFIMVSMSLMILYTIKVCICNRRKKHRAQRNLVGDSSYVYPQNIACSCYNHNHHHHQALETASATAAQPTNSIRTILSRHLRYDNYSSSEQGSYCVERRGFVADSGNNLTLRHLNSTLQNDAHLIPIPAISAPASQHGDCSCCLLNNSAHQLTGPPPTYFETFGRQQEVSIEGDAVSPGASNSYDTAAELDYTSCESPPPSSRNALTTAANSQAANNSNSAFDCDDNDRQSLGSDNPTIESQLRRQQQQERNLLVKLNLNKTKLLSAGDLMLLSKLIDVPIIVQDQQQQQQQRLHQGQQRPAPASSDDSCSANATTINTSGISSLNNESSCSNASRLLVDQSDFMRAREVPGLAKVDAARSAQAKAQDVEAQEECLNEEREL